jgi:hypothetical protein
MKKYIFQVCVMLCGALGFTACSEDEGTMPGNDAQPSVVIYKYDAARPNNPDNDVQLRFATNNRTAEAYYLAEKANDKATRVASLGQEGYADYVISNGTKLSGVDGESNVDVLITDLYGTYAITAVAVNGTQKVSSETTFIGLEWEEGIPGVYYFSARGKNATGLTSAETTLQKCTTDDTLYRFKDLYGSGYSLKITLLPDYQGSDEDGVYTFFRVPATETPFEYGNYGTVSVRDLGYWLGNDAYITTNGYESGMYEDGSCFVCVQYYVSAGSLGYGYDAFYPY